MYVLASCSPRRKELLSKIISNFKIIPSDVDEESLLTSVNNVMEVPEFLSTQKALQVFKSNNQDLVIAADTSIIYEDKIYGKPKDENDAKKMLSTFSDNTHYVVTGVCVVSSNRTISFSSINEVSFYKLTDEEIEEYLSQDEYKDKAGAYAIQGNAFKFIKHISGDYNSIIGLPISELNRVLKKFF